MNRDTQIVGYRGGIGRDVGWGTGGRVIRTWRLEAKRINIEMEERTEGVTVLGGYIGIFFFIQHWTK